MLDISWQTRRALEPGLQKLADDNDGQDSSFEKSFSDIVHLVLKDKAPQLLDYELGFQLIDRDQDAGKAVGVCMFRVGPNFLMAPSFFLHGKLKGSELLYVKNLDQFVPLQEGWIQHLLDKHPDGLGTQASRNLGQLGVSAPDLRQITRPPTKYAGDKAGFLDRRERVSPLYDAGEFSDPEDKGALDDVVRYGLLNDPHRRLYHPPPDDAGVLKKVWDKVKTLGDGPHMKAVMSKVPPDDYDPDNYEGPPPEPGDRHGAIRAKITPYRKTASAALDEALPALARILTSDPFTKFSYSLEDFVKEAGAPAVEALASLLAHCPRIAYDVEKYHGPALIEACKAAMAAPRPALHSFGSLLDDESPHPKEAELEEITYDKAEDDESLFGPTPGKQRPAPDRFDLKDMRPDRRVATPYALQVEQQLTNPTHSGLYDVLMRPRTYEKCFVATAPMTASGAMRHCVVARLSDKKFAVAHPGSIWIGKEYSTEDYRDWLGGLPGVDSLDVHKLKDSPPGSPWTEESSAYQIIVDPRGDASAPFQARFLLGVADGGKTYQGRFETWSSDGCSPAGVSTSEISMNPYVDPTGNVSVGTGRGSKLFAAGGTLFAPDGSKVLGVDRVPYDEPMIQFGQPIDVTLDVIGKLDKLELQAKEGSIRVGDRTFRSEKAALRHLVFDRNFRLPAAETLLGSAKAAAYKADPIFRCVVKKADPYLTDTKLSAPGIPEPQMTTEETLTQQVPGLPRQMRLLPVTDLRQRDDVGQIYNLRNLPPPPWMIQQIQQAAATGSREVFDTSVMSSMLSATQGDLQVDRFFGPMMQNIDAIGRLLVNFYWHGEDFEERYGKDDMVSLEDMLRNTFISCGKLILSLKEKGTEDPLDANRDMDLESDSDQ